jgi:hypothetical protein
VMILQICPIFDGFATYVANMSGDAGLVHTCGENVVLEFLMLAVNSKIR